MMKQLHECPALTVLYENLIVNKVQNLVDIVLLHPRTRYR